jgi:hypothetical protein
MFIVYCIAIRYMFRLRHYAKIKKEVQFIVIKYVSLV